MPIIFNENGLVIQSLAEIKEELKNGYTVDGVPKKGYVQHFGLGIQLEDETGIGKQLSIYAERELLVQEKIEAVNDSAYRASAGGVSLDRTLEAIELQRQGGLPSTVIVYAAGTPSTIVSAEDLRMSVEGTGDLFFNIDIFTLGGLVDESVDTIIRISTTVTVTIGGGHSFPLGSFVFIEGAEQEEYNGLHEITAVTATTFDYELIGILPVTPATGTIIAREATPFNAESVLNGTIQALDGAINTIATAVNGITRVENADDAVLGRLTETDPKVRTRADESLAVLGAATSAAIQSKILNVTGVTFVQVFQNVTDFIDANGLPPHSIRVVVSGGDDNDIFNTLFLESVSAGIKMDGTETTTIIDNAGEPQPVAFSRPTVVSVFVDAGNGLTTNSDPAQGTVFPANGSDLIIAALIAIPFILGADVWPSLIKGAIDSVDGVITSDPEFDITPAPTNKATIIISSSDLAEIDSGDITGLP